MEYNKLIAEFMGANPFRESVNEDVLSYEMYGLIESIEDGVYEKHFFLPSEMKFHTSWDWLMPVIENIDHLQYESVKGIEDALSTRHIGDTHKAVVEFLKDQVCHVELQEWENKIKQD